MTVTSFRPLSRLTKPGVWMCATPTKAIVRVPWFCAQRAGVAAAAGLLLVGWIGLHWMDLSVWPPWAEPREAGNTKAQAENQAEAETKRKSEEAEQQRLATLKAEQERQARAIELAVERRAKAVAEEAKARLVHSKIGELLGLENPQK